MTIRPYRPGDDLTLANLNPNLFPYQLDSIGHNGGYVRVIEEGGIPAGYITAIPVPGLSGLMDFGLFMVVARRRQGLGSLAVQQFIQELRPLGVKSLTYPVADLSDPAGQFLRRNGFTIEHEEMTMVHDNLKEIPPVRFPAGVSLITYPFPAVSNHFITLYEQSFGGTPSYQPFSEVELMFELSNPADLLFLRVNQRLVGFVWTRLEGDDVGAIEPLGVIAGEQGKGYGRLLLLAGLHHLHRHGARRGRLGVWTNNRPALNLYESVGFRPVKTLTYLHYQLTK